MLYVVKLVMVKLDFDGASRTIVERQQKMSNIMCKNKILTFNHSELIWTVSINVALWILAVLERLSASNYRMIDS